MRLRDGVVGGLFDGVKPPNDGRMTRGPWFCSDVGRGHSYRVWDDDGCL